MVFNVKCVYLTFIYAGCRLIFNPFRTVAGREATNKTCTATISCCDCSSFPFFFFLSSLLRICSILQHYTHLFWILNHARGQECSQLLSYACVTSTLHLQQISLEAGVWNLSNFRCLTSDMN